MKQSKQILERALDAYPIPDECTPGRARAQERNRAAYVRGAMASHNRLIAAMHGVRECINRRPIHLQVPCIEKIINDVLRDELGDPPF